MPSYLHPGVYLEEIPSGAKPIEGVATSVAAFVGEAARGPTGQAMLVHSFDEYQALYGPISSETDAMGFAVAAFYGNGGKDAYVARMVKASTAVAASFPLLSENAVGIASVSASSVGPWGQGVYFRITKASTSALRFKLEVGHLETGPSGQKFKVDETFSDLGMNEHDPSYALARVNGSSALVTLSLGAAGVVGPELRHGTLTGTALANDAEALHHGLTGPMTITVNVDGIGPKVIHFDPAGLGLAGTSLDTDGAAVAGALQLAIQAVSPFSEPYKSFQVAYDAGTRRFTLTSPSLASYSSVQVYDIGDTTPSLASVLKLDTASTPTAVHGSARLLPRATPASGSVPDVVSLAGGVAEKPTGADYTTFFDGVLKKVRDVSILVLPGAQVGSDVVSRAVTHCEDTRSRVVIIDPPPATALAQAADVDALTPPTSTYSVLYYPWVKVPNPFYNPESTAPGNPTVTVAPSGFAAGLWSRTDGRRGVWKAPAGVEASLLGVAGLQFDVGDGEQDQLNPAGVNCLRKLPSFGPVIWGARTLATKADPEWRYVPVRRTAIFIEQSIYNGIQWAVFEPNDHRLWASLRANISSFMDGIFRAGAFQGEKASDAYFVRCGLGDTMTQGDIDRGQVIVIVGFAPLKPAEFVIVRIQQKVQQ